MFYIRFNKKTKYVVLLLNKLLFQKNLFTELKNTTTKQILTA